VAAEFPCVEIRRENEFAVTGRIVDHPSQHILGIDLVADAIEQTDQSFMAFQRRTGAVELPGQILFAQLLEELTDLTGSTAAEIGCIIARAIWTSEDVANGILVDAARLDFDAVEKPRFEVYKAVSQQIREIFAEHTLIIEPLSLDEAYLDVTENLQGFPLARDVALAIRGRIKEVTGLNASAGISYNKFLAKLASDHRKPNGQYVITPEMGPAFVEALPVEKFHGIGPATSAKMNSLGLRTGLDMRDQSLDFLQENFGKTGDYYYWISRGEDHREVRSNRIRKSVGAESTFSSDLTEFDPMAAELQPLIDKVWQHCEDKGSRGRTVTLKVKFNDFEIITRSRSVPGPVASREDLERLAVALLQNEVPFPRPVRLLGVSLSSLQSEEQKESQLGLPI
jgi:DNA polymerase-4